MVRIMIYGVQSAPNLVYYPVYGMQYITMLRTGDLSSWPSPLSDLCAISELLRLLKHPRNDCESDSDFEYAQGTECSVCSRF